MKLRLTNLVYTWFIFKHTRFLTLFRDEYNEINTFPLRWSLLVPYLFCQTR